MSAVSNGFKILETICAAGNDGLPFARVVEQTRLPKANVHRLLKELVELSALSYEPASRHYRGGLTLARLGANIVSNYDLRKTAQTHLRALHEETGHVVTLGILGEDVGIYIDKIEARDFGIRLHSEVGKSFPLHCTGMGKVLLASAPPELRQRVLRRKLEALTDKTITDPRKLRTELKEVREQGYAIDHEEITRGLMCVAAPVFGVAGEVAGAMSCTFPRYLFDERGMDTEIEALLRHARAASGLPETGLNQACNKA